jgi:penicillin amidase
MASTSPALIHPSRRRTWLKVIAFLLLLAFASIAFLRWYLVHVERVALPQLDGEIRASGVKAPVSVLRDHQGVPHITASTLNDLAFAQGYVTAQDRLWQMDMLRRVAAGDLAEILGSGYVALDKRQRYLQTRHAAESAVQNLNPEERSALNAYTQGVNAFIADAQGKLPLEFTLLRYKPHPWTPVDSLLVGVNMAQMLNTSYPDDLHHEFVASKLSPELLSDLYPISFWRDHPPGSEPVEIKDDVPPPEVPDEEGALDPDGWLRRLGLDLAPQCSDCRAGSNDWVVSGAHSVTGKPLLSNDMHLEHSVPGIWYEAHLKLTDGSLDVAGVTLPGVPAVVVGHNQRIAWGFTNVGPDVQDLYVEQVQGDQYVTPQGLKPLEHRHEVIQVARGRNVEFDVDVTRHGPIITPVLKNESRPLALRWTLYESNGLSFPFFDVDRARNWQEFTTAFSRFAGPGQNVVYADIDGHIGYHATGLVPLRANGDGTVPVPGADDAHEWTGYIPFDKLPQSYDPPAGVLATANNRIAPDSYPYLITKDWASPYRVERIYQVLQSKPKLSADDMLSLQTDVYSAANKFFADRFAYAVDHTQNADAKLRQAAELLRGWNGRMDADSAAARIVAAARRTLWETILSAKLGDNWKSYTSWGSTAVLESIVNRQLPRWLPPGYADWNVLLSDQLGKAIKSAPSDLKSWKFGDWNKVTVENPVLAGAPFVGKYRGPGTQPQSGDGTTVKQVGSDFGPSERFTADFSDWDHSRLNIVVGQSGNFLSPHYMDQWDAWYRGTTFPLAFTDPAIQSAKEHELRFLPGGAQ